MQIDKKPSVVSFVLWQSAKLARGVILCSLICQILSAILIVFSIALISLGARLVLNPDTDLLVRSFNLSPDGLTLDATQYFLIGLGVLISSLAIGYIGRTCALRSEAMIAGRLKEKLVGYTQSPQSNYRGFLHQKFIDPSTYSNVVSSGCNIVGNIVRIGLYQSSNLTFFILTSLILAFLAPSMAGMIFGLIIAGGVLLFLLIKKAEKTQEGLKDVKRQNAAYNKYIIQQASGHNQTYDLQKLGLGEHVSIQRKLSKNIGILESARLACGLLFGFGFFAIVVVFFLYVGKETEVLFPAIFVIILARQFSTSVLSLMIYITAAARFSVRIRDVAITLQSLDAIKNRVEAENLSLDADMQANSNKDIIDSPVFYGKKLVFLFLNYQEREKWFNRLTSFLNVDSLKMYTLFHNNFVIQSERNDLETVKISTNKEKNLLEDFVKSSGWALPSTFSVEACVNDENFTPVFVRRQLIALLDFLQQYNAADTHVYLRVETFLSFRQETLAFLKNRFNRKILVYGAWNKKILDAVDFDDGYFMNDAGQVTQLTKEKLKALDEKDRSLLTKQANADPLSGEIDTSFFDLT